MQSKIKLLSILISFLFMISCDDESPLSDVEISDPSILTARININQDKFNNKDFELKLLDKNGSSVKLKTGVVKINDNTCMYEDGLITKAYQYEIGSSDQVFNVEIQFNSDINNKYNFTIDKSVYPGFDVNTPNSSMDYNTLSGSSVIQNAPFRDGTVVVEYSVLVNK